jgi:Lrp/AsnC family leucine-responsive transcriptional regulator
MSADNTPPPLDEIDIQLVAALQEDCKVSFNKLGEQVGLSAPSVMERVRKLEQTGVIKGYHALIDGRKVGLDIIAFIGVSINYPKKIEAFETWVDAEPHVLECYHVTGFHTLILKVKCRNTHALEQLISKIREIDGVERTETMVVLSTRTERVQVPLETAGQDAQERKARRQQRRR